MNKEYPYQDGDFLVLGPEIFTDLGAGHPVITWKGEHYYLGKCQHIECAYCYEKERRERENASLGAKEQ